MKKTILYVLGGLIALLLIVMAFFSLYKGQSSRLTNQTNLNQPDLIQRGAYLATAGDCVACHTSKGKPAFAGGLGIASPIGTLYSSNITPDPETGIGAFSLADFDNAVRYGIGKENGSLYPAMPYPSYSILSDDDVTALYAYFQYGVKPVKQAKTPNTAPWPLSMRWPLTAWRLAFSPTVKAFDASRYADASIARGAYLTQGLGHCGTCHTPRSSLTMNELAYSEKDGAKYLSGSATPIDGWIAINLRSDHKDGLGSLTEAQLAQFLKTGKTEHTAAFGGMSEVIADSLQHLSDEDLTAIARYLKTLPAVSAENPPFVYDQTIAAALQKGDDRARGAAAYIDNCAACHRTSGLGYPNSFPALAGNPVVQSQSPASLVTLLQKGHTQMGTKTSPTEFSMPDLAWRLSTEEQADLLTFIRTSWGNRGTAVTAKDVKKFTP